MESYASPFHSTPAIQNLSIEIAEMVGRLDASSDLRTNPILHRALRIKTIHSSLAIEGNVLSQEQTTAILNGQRVIGDSSDIREVENATRAYDLLPFLDPYSIDDLLRVHKVMTEDLITEAGRFRYKNAGVFDGERLIHAGSPANYVPELVSQLFKWIKETPLHPLIASCIFHYEFEVIHPFADGNGRTGRLWHTLLLSRWRSVLEWLPIESMIMATQQDYYAAFAQSESKGESGPFVEYMLGAIRQALLPYCVKENPRDHRKEALLDFVAKHPTATIAQVAEELGTSRATIDRVIAELRAEGRLERQGSSRAGSWMVRR